MKKPVFLLILASFLLCLCACQNNIQAEIESPANHDTIPETPVLTSRGEQSTDPSAPFISESSAAAETGSAQSEKTTLTTTQIKHETTATTVPTGTTSTTKATTAATTGTPGKTTASETDPRTVRNNLLERIRENINGVTAGPVQTDPAFFDDVVFIGDSVTMGLRNYVTTQRNNGKECLGSAKFLTCGSMSYTNTLGPIGPKSMHPTYQGAKVTVPDGISKTGMKKVFIMLGMNDFAAYDAKVWQANVITLLDQIKEKNPDASIYIESVTPIMDGKEHGRFTNKAIAEFNAYMNSLCAERGCTYVDIYSVLADETGHLRKEYCGDAEGMGIHMSYVGAEAWVNFLQKTFCGV